MSKNYLLRVSIAMGMLGLLVGFFGWSTFTAAEEAHPPTSTDSVEPSDSSAVLENPTFDNHDWYEFHLRYDSTYPVGAYLPDADNDEVSEPYRQDWRLWFWNGTDILEPDPEQTLVHSDEAVQMRAYGNITFEDWNVGHHVGGIYQVVHNTTPCLHYEFTMMGQARYDPPHDKKLDTPPDVNTLRVGIDRSGWYLDPDDPAVHGGFPTSTQWGESQIHYETYGELSVTAEAWGDKITVFTYADAEGGRATRVLWDTGSFSEVTPAYIFDPDTYTGSSGIFGLGASTDGSGNVLITWSTSQPAISQVYYSFVGDSPGTPSDPLPNVVYLPLVYQPHEQVWHATALDKSAKTSHAVTLSGLASGDYEYIVVSKGYAGGEACETWTDRGEFTVP